MSGRAERLRVVVATPVAEEHCKLIEQLEPRVDLIRNHALYPPMRHAADFSGDPAFRRTPAQELEFQTLLGQAEALYGIPDVNPTYLKWVADTNASLRWVHTMAAGGGAQVRAACLTSDQLERIRFTTSAGVHGGPLAEFALMGLLAGAKDLPLLQSHQRERLWTGRWEMRQLSEMTVLVVGLGGIGTEVARLASALGATVIGSSRSQRPVPGVHRTVPIEALPHTLPHVDAVVLTLPGTTATEGLFDDDLFSHFAPGTTLVNVGRGTVVDEKALVTALRNGRVGFAALDVFAVEPLTPESPLWDQANVLVSPHTAALNSAEDRRIAELFAENATRLLDDLALRNQVDTVDFY